MSRLSPEARELAAYAAATMQMTHAVRCYQKRKSVSSILLGKAIEALLSDLADAERERDEMMEFARKANAGHRESEDGWRAVWHDREALRAQVATLREALAGLRPFIVEDFPHDNVNDPRACVTKPYRAAAKAMEAALASTVSEASDAKQAAPAQAAQEGGEG